MSTGAVSKTKNNQGGRWAQDPNQLVELAM